MRPSISKFIEIPKYKLKLIRKKYGDGRVLYSPRITIDCTLFWGLIHYTKTFGVDEIWNCCTYYITDYISNEWFPTLEAATAAVDSAWENTINYNMRNKLIDTSYVLIQ